MKSELKVLDGKFQTYYEALGISEERAMALIDFTKEVYEIEANSTKRWQQFIDAAQNFNEMIFLIHKGGEISGMQLAVERPGEAVNLINKIAVGRIVNKVS